MGRTLRWKAHRKRRVFTKSKPPSEKATSSCPWDTTRRRVAFAKRKDLKGEPLPSTVPQGYARPLTRRPRLSTRTLLPMTAKGTLSCTHAHARQQYAGRQPAPTRGRPAGADGNLEQSVPPLEVVVVLLVRVAVGEAVDVDPEAPQLLADLRAGKKGAFGAANGPAPPTCRVGPRRP